MGADRKDFLQEGGKALGKGGSFMQKLLFGSKPAPQAKENLNNFQMTPEQQAMRDQGLADNPWLSGEGDSQVETDRWWDEQEYPKDPDKSYGSGYAKGIGNLLRKGSEWWWGGDR